MAVGLVSCTEPSIDPVGFAFPDSITQSMGLPPVAHDPGTLRIAPDTFALARILGPSSFDQTTTPRKIHVQLTVTDSMNQLRPFQSLPLADCPVSLSIRARGQANVAWTSSSSEGDRCPSVQGINGASAIDVAWPVSTILGDSLRVDTYTATAEVKTASGTVLRYGPAEVYLDTALVTVSRDYGALRFSATTYSDPDEREFVTRVVVTNPTDRYIELATGGDCYLNVDLFTRQGRRVWQSEFRHPHGLPGVYYGCDDVLVLTWLHPGDSSVFLKRFGMIEATQDGVPPGYYLVGAKLPDLHVELPAGAVSLVATPDVQSSGVFDSLSATATTRLLKGSTEDTLRTLVLVTNRTNHRISTTVSSPCTISLYAYRDAGRKTEVSMADPSPGGVCYVQPYPIALDPGESWVFGRDTPTSLIRQRVGAGHYWFTASLLTRKFITLAAGDADIR
jgi:hypothetical protein